MFGCGPRRPKARERTTRRSSRSHFTPPCYPTGRRGGRVAVELAAGLRGGTLYGMRKPMEYYGAGRVWRGTPEQDQSLKECLETFERIDKALHARNPEAPP